MLTRNKFQNTTTPQHQSGGTLQWTQETAQESDSGHEEPRAMHCTLIWHYQRDESNGTFQPKKEVTEGLQLLQVRGTSGSVGDASDGQTRIQIW